MAGFGPDLDAVGPTCSLQDDAANSCAWRRWQPGDDAQHVRAALPSFGFRVSNGTTMQARNTWSPEWDTTPVPMPFGVRRTPRPPAKCGVCERPPCIEGSHPERHGVTKILRTMGEVPSVRAHFVHATPASSNSSVSRSALKGQMRKSPHLQRIECLLHPVLAMHGLTTRRRRRASGERIVRQARLRPRCAHASVVTFWRAPPLGRDLHED